MEMAFQKKITKNNFERREKSLNEIRMQERQERNVERLSANMKQGNREIKRANFGVLGKKIKRMESIIKERNNNSNERHSDRAPQIAN